MPVSYLLHTPGTSLRILARSQRQCRATRAIISLGAARKSRAAVALSLARSCLSGSSGWRAARLSFFWSGEGCRRVLWLAWSAATEATWLPNGPRVGDAPKKSQACRCSPMPLCPSLSSSCRRPASHSHTHPYTILCPLTIETRHARRVRTSMRTVISRSWPGMSCTIPPGSRFATAFVLSPCGRQQLLRARDPRKPPLEYMMD